MARGAVVVIPPTAGSGGTRPWRGEERLAPGASNRVVNPRVSADAFAVRSGGMVAALPHCDARERSQLRGAFCEVAEVIGAAAEDDGAPARPLTEVASDEVETWGSATPVAGSSVGMPSGHGPSRGNVTPGWVTEE